MQTQSNMDRSASMSEWKQQHQQILDDKYGQSNWDPSYMPANANLEVEVEGGLSLDVGAQAKIGVNNIAYDVNALSVNLLEVNGSISNNGTNNLSYDYISNGGVYNMNSSFQVNSFSVYNSFSTYGTGHIPGTHNYGFDASYFNVSNSGIGLRFTGSAALIIGVHFNIGIKIKW